MKHNEFDNEEKYKLYRQVNELLHPTISKKNISNYRIIIAEELLPLRVFYPLKVSNMKNIVIYIHGEEKVTGCEKKYSNISSNFSKKYNNLVISIDYDNYTNLSLKELHIKIYNTLKKIYKDLLKTGILKENITLIGDSTAATMILSLTKKMYKDSIIFGKYILFYPPVSGNYSKIKNSLNLEFFSNLKEYYRGIRKSSFPINDKLIYPKTLILCGKVDPLLEEIKEFSNVHEEIKLKEITFADHGFLGSNDKEINNEYTMAISKFMK